MCEFALLQNVNVKFPFSQRQPDFSTTILTLLSPSQLTVMCNEYIAKYSVGSIGNSLNKCTHSNSVIAGLYESNFNYVSAKSNLALNFYSFCCLSSLLSPYSLLSFYCPSFNFSLHSFSGYNWQ